ncbi:MAG: hypothetical protein ACREAD_05790 [Nitrosopumilaceae archaeon]
MKSLAFVLLVLVGSLVLTNLPAPSYADSNLDALLRIVTQARDNINIQLSQVPTVPGEINQLYKQGSGETDALMQSVSQGDQASSREHFLSAMKIFKEVNDKISSLTPVTTNEQPSQSDMLQLRSEINRIQNLENKLETIAITNNVQIDFTKFNETMQDARQNLDANNMDQVNKDLKITNQLLLDIHHLLVDAANKKASDRAKDFTEKQIERLSQANETKLQNKMPSQINKTNQPQNIMPNQINETKPQNVTQLPIPITKSLPHNTSTNQTEDIPGMIVQLKHLVSEGKIDQALKLIKLIEAIQNQAINSTSTTESPNTISPANVSNVNTQEITNPVNNSTASNQTNSSIATGRNNHTQSEAVNNVNATQNATIHNLPHIDNKKKSHENGDNQTQSETVNNANTAQNANTANNAQHDDNNKQSSHKEINSKSKDLKKTSTNNSKD